MFRKYLEGVLGNLWKDFCMYFSRIHNARYRPLQATSKSSTVTCQEDFRVSELLLWKSKKWVKLVSGTSLLSWVLQPWLSLSCPYICFLLDLGPGLPPGAGPKVFLIVPVLLKFTCSMSFLRVPCCFLFLLDSSYYLANMIKITYSHMENPSFLLGNIWTF